MATLAYNALMSAVCMTALLALYRLQSRRVLAAAFLLAGFSGALFAVFFGEDFFGIMRLLAYGVFLYGFVMLAGTATIVRRSFPRTASTCAVSTVLTVALAIDSFLIEPGWLEVTRLRLVTPKIGRPLKIVVLADLQTDCIDAYERVVLRRALREKPDLILLPGDYIQEADPTRRAELRGQLHALLTEIGLDAPMGAYAVAGNVDSRRWPEIFEGMPVTAFEDTRSVDLPDLRITGLAMRDSFNPALQVPAAEAFHIVLGHSPDFALSPDIDADLLVAGHTHGGQVRLPLLGSVLTLSRVPRKWAAGTTDLGDGRTLLVSRGIGMERGFAPRLRFLCRPEIVVIELVPEPSSTTGTDAVD